MDFELSPKHKELQRSAKLMVEQTVLPQIMEFEEKSLFPRALFREIGDKGFLRAPIPEKHGGLGLGTMGYCLVSEELAKAGAGMTHNGHFQTQKMLVEHGTQIQRDKYLNKLGTGEYLGATAISEPTVGSSFEDMRTRAEKQDDIFIVNGLKTLINDAAEANVISVFAKAREGISAFLVEGKNPGFHIIKKLDPIGMRSSPVYEFELRDCKVEAQQLVGEFGEGLKAFFSAFNFSRLGNASACLGMGQAAFETALTYVKERNIGHHKAAEFQGIRWILAEMSSHLEAARLIRNRAAIMEDNKQDISLESSRAKLICVEVANHVVPDCIQITGRYGCLRGNLLELYLRDIKVLGIAGGSLEVMKNNIARRLIGS
jgi:alkylation response protein AidB-like acyl-CoA dehydrogenase